MWRIPFILLIAGSLQAQFAFPEESLLLQRFDIFVPTTLYSESFEATKPTGNGYDNASTETQLLIDSDDTTAATGGSQNLKITQNVGSTYVFPNAGWTPASKITLRFSFQVDNTNGLNQIIQMDATADNTGRAYIWIKAGGAVMISGNSSGANTVSTVDPIDVNTQYYFQAIWDRTSGAYSVEFNTTGFNNFTYSGNKYASATDGDTTGTIGDLRYRAEAAGYTTKFDQVVVTTP